MDYDFFFEVKDKILLFVKGKSKPVANIKIKDLLEKEGYKQRGEA